MNKIEKILNYIDNFNLTDEETGELAGLILSETDLSKDPMIAFIENLSENGQNELFCRLDDHLNKEES